MGSFNICIMAEPFSFFVTGLPVLAESVALTWNYANSLIFFSYWMFFFCFAFWSFKTD